MTVSFGIPYSYSDFFIPLQQQFGWSYLEASTIPALSLIVFSFGSMIGGFLVPRFGWRKTSISGALLIGSGLILSSRIENFEGLLLLFGIVTSFGMALTVICSGPIVVKWFIKRRGLAVGVAASGSGIGTLLVPPIAQRLISIYGWRLTFLEIGISFLVLLTIASYFMKTPEEVSEKPYGWNDLTAIERSNIKDYSFKQALSTNRFWMIFAMFFLGTVGSSMFVVHAAPFGLTQGINGFYASIALGMFGAGSLISRLIVGGISDRLSRTTTLIMALSSEFIGLAMLPFVSFSLWLFFICGFLIGFGYGGYLADFIALLGDLFGVRALAGIWGFTETSFGIGGLLGPIIAGIYFQQFGNYTGIFELAATGVCVALIISLQFTRSVCAKRIIKTI